MAVIIFNTLLSCVHFNRWYRAILFNVSNETLTLFQIASEQSDFYIGFGLLLTLCHSNPVHATEQKSLRDGGDVKSNPIYMLKL
jgi:hypothetical protein